MPTNGTCIFYIEVYFHDLISTCSCAWIFYLWHFYTDVCKLIYMCSHVINICYESYQLPELLSVIPYDKIYRAITFAYLFYLLIPKLLTTSIIYVLHCDQHSIVSFWNHCLSTDKHNTHVLYHEILCSSHGVTNFCVSQR